MEYLMHASSYFDLLFYALKYSMLKTHFFGLSFVKIFRQKPHFPQNPPPYSCKKWDRSEILTFLIKNDKLFK